MAILKLTRYSLIAASTLALLAAPFTAFAEDAAGEIEKVENEVKADADRPDWDAMIKEKYSLTDAQLQAMKDKGMNRPQIAIASQLAKSSGKSIDEITKMRLESKMGWGKIAKDLGVEPKQIGQAVSSMRKEMHEKRKEHFDKRQDVRKEAFENRQEKREEAFEKREARREERAEKREEHRAQRDAKRAEHEARRAQRGEK